MERWGVSYEQAEILVSFYQFLAHSKNSINVE